MPCTSTSSSAGWEESPASPSMLGVGSSWARMWRKPKANLPCAHDPHVRKSSNMSCIASRDIVSIRPWGSSRTTLQVKANRLSSKAEQLGNTCSWLPILYTEFPPLVRALKAMFYILIKLKEKELDNSLKDLQATSISENDSCSHQRSSSGPAHALMCGTNRFVTVISNMSLFRLHTYHASSQAFHQSC